MWRRVIIMLSALQAGCASPLVAREPDHPVVSKQ
jgi:hypothetical protein